MEKGNIDIYLLNKYKTFHAFNCMLDGVKNAASHMGYELSVITDIEMTLDEYIDNRKKVKNNFTVLSGFKLSDRSQLIERLQAENMCFAIANQYYAERRDWNTVSINHIKAAQDVTHHLFSNASRKKIAFLGFDRFSLVDADKLKGCMNAHDIWGIEFDNNNIFYQDKTSIMETVNCFLEHADNYDGVFCSTDAIAILLINRANTLGVKIPEELCVAGFDGISMGAFIKPSLTTVTANFYDIGTNLVKMASILHSNPSIKFLKLICEHEIIVRQTSGLNSHEYDKENNALSKASVQPEFNRQNENGQIYSDSVFEAIEILDGIFSKPDPFEMKILHMLFEGLYYKEIGAKLSMGERAIKYSMKRMLGRLGIKNRDALQILIEQYLNVSLIDWDLFE